MGSEASLVNAASGTEIGSQSAGAGNVISGNVGAGVALLSGATGTVIQNNEIGLAADGRSALGNQGDGIYLSDSPSNQIGGTDQHQGNLIGANQGNGVNAVGASSHLLVEGNYIGTDVSGTLNLGNQSNGISLSLVVEYHRRHDRRRGQHDRLQRRRKVRVRRSTRRQPQPERDPLELDLPERGPGNQPGKRSDAQSRSRHSRPE